MTAFLWFFDPSRPNEFALFYDRLDVIGFIVSFAIAGGIAWCSHRQRMRIWNVSSESTIGETSDGYHTFNELYAHRHALFSVVVRAFGGWKSRQHSDGTMFDGWFIAGVDTPQGQATYHLPLEWWDRFVCRELPSAPEFDGHTPNDVIQRVQTLLAGVKSDIQIEMCPRCRTICPAGWCGVCHAAIPAPFNDLDACREILSADMTYEPHEVPLPEPKMTIPFNTVAHSLYAAIQELRELRASSVR